MREWINLIEERLSPGLEGVTLISVIAALKQNHDLMHHTWMGRAYDSMSSVTFRKALTQELDQARESLRPIANGPITLMRGLTKPYDGKGTVGVHWTTKRYTAGDHGPFILHATVQSDDVDWPATVARRMGWPKEEEISLKIGATIEVDRITKGDETVAEGFSAIVQPFLK